MEKVASNRDGAGAGSCESSTKVSMRFGGVLIPNPADPSNPFVDYSLLQHFDDLYQNTVEVETKRLCWLMGQALRMEGVRTPEVWMHDGKLHREDGPAIKGVKFNLWWRDGKLHREDGPAVECDEGFLSEGRTPFRQWWRNGVLDRDDGPAHVEGDFVCWWLHGKPIHGTELNDWLAHNAAWTTANRTLFRLRFGSG